MEIKKNNLPRSPLNQFDLLGSDEVGLSKAFAFLLGKEPKVLYKFLQYVGLSISNTLNNFFSTSIEIEKTRLEGRTDIEIRQKGKYHLIVESKIGNNKVRAQRRKYINSFENEKEKILCYITGINDFNKEFHDGIKIYNLSWIEIGDLLDSREFLNNSLVQEFTSFIKKGYKMREQKEILVQDLGDKNEIERYKGNQVYRRDVVFGSPLYFSPYFTRKANQQEGEGILYLSKVLGILSLNPNDIENYTDELLKFSDSNNNLCKKWISGVKKDVGVDKVFTYFFLDKALKLKTPLMKDGGMKKGRGNNWIAGMIPKNRCVSFQEFVKRINK